MSRTSKRCQKCFSAINVVGANNPNWKGDAARHRNRDGYVNVRRLEHPRGARNGGYIFEHILVMEALLGRYLLPGENVHHRNGRRDDNRPKNLELWLRCQPSGRRVAEAVAWAREILARYETDPPVEVGQH